MASIRRGARKDNSPYWSVLYRLDGKQRSTSWNDEKDAKRFKTLVETIGPTKALEAVGLQPPKPASALTVADWLTHHIDHLTGVDPRTLEDYRSYLRKDITPVLGAIPLDALSRDEVRRWVQAMEQSGASAKTIANKHGFLSAALAGAVIAGHIAANPAANTRLPRGEKQEMVFLSREHFGRLLTEIPEHWRPLVEFLVASGARWSEVTALKPGDVDRAHHTVRITRAWKRGGGGYRIGPPKTRRSVRTINVPASVLNKLDYTGEWLFTNPGRGGRAAGGPVRAPNFRTNVWWPAIERAWPKVDEHGQPVTSAPILRPRIHDLRHTCASWLIAAGTPLPVIQRHLGHESIQTTVDVYGHLDRRSAQAAADAIAAALG